MLSVYHVFKDPCLLHRVRYNLQSTFKSTPSTEIDPCILIQDPLLSSVQAETLRLYVNVCVMLSSPHSDIALGRWWMPKGAVGLVHSGITHKDSNFWNTKDGTHPVDSFWADRFITDPADPTSGPTRDPAVRQAHVSLREPSFSLQGLEASWMPYGGKSKLPTARVADTDGLQEGTPSVRDGF
jgi:hypothetical protein